MCDSRSNDGSLNLESMQGEGESRTEDMRDFAESHETPSAVTEQIHSHALSSIGGIFNETGSASSEIRRTKPATEEPKRPASEGKGRHAKDASESSDVVAKDGKAT